MKPFRLLISLLLLLAQSLCAGDDQYARYQRILLEKNDSLKVDELIRYANQVVDSLHEYDLALLIFEKAGSVLKQHHYPALELKLENNWGWACYQKGEYELADQHYIKALSSGLLTKDPVLRAKILNMAAVNLQDLSVYKRALIYYNEALELYTQLNDTRGKGTVYQNMGNIFALAGDYAQSDRFFDKGVKIFLDAKDMENYSLVMGNKAYIKWRLGHLDSAKNIMVRSLQVDMRAFKKMGAVVDRYFNLGLLYAEMMRWDSCFYCIERGKSLSDSLHFLDRFDGPYYYNLGYCYDRKGEDKKAIQYYKKALGIKNGIANYKFLYDNIASLYFENKYYDSAFLYKNESLKITDSIYKSELKEHIGFENKRVELLEKDYQNQIRSARQLESLHSLEKRNFILIGLVIALVVAVLLLFLYLRQYRLRVKKEHLQSELDFLRAQLNPHFLFNSINNIYVLLDENKDKASAVLLKFSELMRYQLYECNVPFIHLGKELVFLGNYIEFEKLRYSNKICVNYELDHAGSGNLLIAPLLLQPFIENAFKHTPKGKQHKSCINIRVALSGKNLMFEVSNTMDSRETSELPGGIGLENVRKRLKLLYFNRHELFIENHDNLFHVTLKLTLAHD